MAFTAQDILAILIAGNRRMEQHRCADCEGYVIWSDNQLRGGSAWVCFTCGYPDGYCHCKLRGKIRARRPFEIGGKEDEQRKCNGCGAPNVTSTTHYVV